jgi:hypothetical protein
MQRDRTLTLPLSSEEWDRFEAVAKDYDMPVTSLVQFLVRREAFWLAPARALSQSERRVLLKRERERLGT